jgi:hypothetical protein
MSSIQKSFSRAEGVTSDNPSMSIILPMCPDNEKAKEKGMNLQDRR